MRAAKEIEEPDLFTALSADAGRVGCAIPGTDARCVVKVARKSATSVRDAQLAGIGEGFLARDEGVDGLAEIALILSMADGSGGQDALGYGQALGLIGVQQCIRGSTQHSSQLPAKVIGILHPCVQALSTGSRVNVCGITREKDSARAIAIHHADIRAPDREPARMAQMHTRHARALIEEALEGRKRRGRQRSLLIWRNGSAEEPGIAVTHPLESQASVKVAPGMCEVSVQPADVDVAQ